MEKILYLRLSSIKRIIINFIKILFTGSSKTQRKGRQFVNKGTLLRYLLSTTK